MYEEGYDVEVLQEISSDLYCVICLKLMRNPVQFKCGHGMCFNCYKHLVYKAKNKGLKDVQCPQCREIVRENQTFSNVMLHRLILSLPVYCTNDDDHCNWMGEVCQLDEHLTVCIASQGKKMQAESSPMRKKNTGNNLTQDNLQSNMMLNMMDTLSALNCKIETIEKHIVCTTTPVIKTTCPTCANSMTTKHESHKKSRQLADHKSFWWRRYFVDSENQNMYLKVCFFVAIVSIYLMTAKLFYTFENPPQSPASCYNDIQAPDRNLMNQLEKTSNESGRGFQTLLSFLVYNMKVHLHDLQSQEIEAAFLIPDFYREQNRTLGEMNRRFHWLIEQSRVDITANISQFDARSTADLSVDNVSLLMNMIQPTVSELWRRIFEEINFSEYRALRNAETTVEQVRHNYWAVREKAEFSAQEMKENEEFHGKKIEYQQLIHNITQRYKTIDKEKIDAVVIQDFVKVRTHYEHLLRNYYLNITHTVSFETRFQFLMTKVQNVNLKNGRFVWQLNATLLQTVEKGHVFHSQHFQSGSFSTAKLMLYPDQSKKGYWKLTFTQTEDRSVKIWLSIMSQIRPEVLLCFENPLGGVLPVTKKTTKVVKHFSIPMNTTELLSKGFIQNNNIFIRCLTTD